MSNPNENALDLVRTLVEQSFWGVLSLKFQHGEVVHITKEESIQPNQQVPNYRRNQSEPGNN